MPLLPEPIATFFALPSDADAARLGHVFTDDAVVRDESHEHRGIPAIRAWRIDAMARTPFTARPLSVEQRGDDTIVPTEVTGAFPGSPVVLSHRFTLRDDRIAALEIA